ncbi:rRNA maturation RNase YbeY [Marinilabiliaceae bacterium ANBcel2]|nr:rRNA maturation RNase YbeY [Marinilabiliaceae bacterium ANBcel2]
MSNSSIAFFSEGFTTPDFDYDSIRRWIYEVVSSNDFDLGEVSFIFCNDEYLLKMNRDYIGHDYYTDIISFDYSSDKFISGDIFISLDTVKTNSDKYSVSFFNELLRVLIHGIFHFIGFNDLTDEEKEVMRKVEDDALELYLSKYS